MGWCEACEVDSYGYFCGNLGVNLGGVDERAVESEDAIKFLDVSVLVKVHKVGG